MPMGSPPPFGRAAFCLKSVAPPEISPSAIFASLLPFVALQAIGLAIVPSPGGPVAALGAVLAVGIDRPRAFGSPLEELGDAAHKQVDIPEFAFPYRHCCPPLGREFSDVSCVPFEISLKLSVPIVPIRGGPIPSRAAVVAMPKATMYEDCLLAARKS
jgi:hypothetical protein